MEHPWKAHAPQYDADHLAVWGKNLGFMSDPKFLSAYARGENSGQVIAQAYGLDRLGIEWRVHVCCWAAMHARHLAGDFVECGVNTGVISLAVCEYIDFNSTEKSFWLFDTFRGIPQQQISAAERDRARPENDRLFPDCWDLARRNFAPFPRAKLIRGVVPDTLALAPIERVCYLSLDMNIAYPERAAIEYFWPKLTPGALVVLDDYAWQGYEEQKVSLDAFAAKMNVAILTLPTGQGLIVKPPDLPRAA
jgi:hypothetical protein